MSWLPASINGPLLLRLGLPAGRARSFFTNRWGHKMGRAFGRSTIAIWRRAFSRCVELLESNGFQVEAARLRAWPEFSASELMGIESKLQEEFARYRESSVKRSSVWAAGSPVPFRALWLLWCSIPHHLGEELDVESGAKRAGLRIAELAGELDVELNQQIRDGE